MSTQPVANNISSLSTNGSSDPTAKNKPTLDANGVGVVAGRGSISSMKVQDFMSYLAKEANISNMTVETNDGRRISATFEQGVDDTTNQPLPSPADLSEANGNGNAVVKEEPLDGKKDEKDGCQNASALMSPTKRDIAATMAMMGANKDASTSGVAVQGPDLETHASLQWAVNYRNKHVAVTYSSIGAGNSSLLTNGSAHKTNGNSSALPPKKRAAKQEEGPSESADDWNPMTALADAATVVQREHVQVPQGVPGIAIAQAQAEFAKSMGKSFPPAAQKKKTAKRKSRKIVPEVKVFVDFNQKDVLFGRGGRSNHHPGNKTYRDIVTKQQSFYRGCDKNEKTKVAQGIVDHIQNTVGGRFLELDREVKQWFLVPNVVARRKVGQALRENNTEEARAAKRAKYQKRLNSNKNFDASEGGDNTYPKAPVVPGDIARDSNMQVVAVNGSASTAIYPIVGTTGTYTRSFQVEDSESSNRVEV
ncbi:unnamed protein product [Pseudo-nitzschia multistriata]|uniref:DUF6824 domain-containing protein n=1 Tax=Pseudo-nitzschia multistriata TaxID=183589 RepID=A0A448YV08_9STRA|nr:unnamed protein product [Pseudo-nitzschia multistriata]